MPEQVFSGRMTFPSFPSDINGFSTALIDRLPVALMFVDENNRLAAANQAMLELLGEIHQKVIGRTVGQVCQPLENLLAQIAPEETTSQEFICPQHTGGNRFRVYLAPLSDPRTGKSGRLILLWNLDRSLPTRPAEIDSEEREIPASLLFESILESIRHGILVTDADGVPVYFNPVLLSLWEETAAAMQSSRNGWPMLFGQRLKNPERLLRLVRAVRDQPGAEMVDFLELTNGRVLECLSRRVTPKHGGSAVRVWSFEDITEQQRTEHELHFLSTHDGLTGLYNRAYFELQLRQLYTYPAYPVSMIMVDVDGLKKINDRLGHPAGDSLLIQGAEVMRRACRAEDIVARLGGDEFGILLLRADAQSVGRICERILHLQTLHNINHPELPLSLSIGMATAAGNRELQDLFSRADEDMYRKRRHRRHVRPVARKYWGKRNPRRR